MPIARFLMLPALLGVLLSVPGRAQSLEPIEQQVEDLSVLSKSLRVVEPGLERPSGFDQVYRLPDSTRFVRVEGGLYAVFGQSVYLPDDEGVDVPVIPNDTIFHIGPPGRSWSGFERPAVVSPLADELRLSGRIELRVEPETVDEKIVELPVQARDPGDSYAAGRGPIPAPRGPVTIVTSRAYRTQRLRVLLEDAALAALARRSGSAPR